MIWFYFSQTLQVFFFNIQNKDFKEQDHRFRHAHLDFGVYFFLEVKTIVYITRRSKIILNSEVKGLTTIAHIFWMKEEIKAFIHVFYAIHYHFIVKISIRKSQVKGKYTQKVELRILWFQLSIFQDLSREVRSRELKL